MEPQALPLGRSHSASGIWARSAASTRQEAKRPPWLRRIVQSLGDPAPDVLILLGAGPGYLPESLAAQWSGQIFCWDPFPELSAALNLDLEGLGDHVQVIRSPEEFLRSLQGLFAQHAPQKIVIRPPHRNPSWLCGALPLRGSIHRLGHCEPYSEPSARPRWAMRCSVNAPSTR